MVHEVLILIVAPVAWHGVFIAFAAPFAVSVAPTAGRAKLSGYKPLRALATMVGGL